MKIINIIFVIVIFCCCSITMTNIVDCSGLKEEDVLDQLFDYSVIHNPNVPLSLGFAMKSAEDTIKLAIMEDNCEEEFLKLSQLLKIVKLMTVQTDFDKFPFLDSDVFDKNNGNGSMLIAIIALLKRELLKAAQCQ